MFYYSKWSYEDLPIVPDPWKFRVLPNTKKQFEVLRQLKELSPETEVIMLTADSTLERGLQAMRLGAYDYVTKPAHIRALKELCFKAVEKVDQIGKHLSGVAQVHGGVVPALVHPLASLGSRWRL